MIICSCSSSNGSNCYYSIDTFGVVVVVTNNLIILCIPQRTKHVSGIKWLLDAKAKLIRLLKSHSLFIENILSYNLHVGRK